MFEGTKPTYEETQFSQNNTAFCCLSANVSEYHIEFRDGSSKQLQIHLYQCEA